MHLLRFFILSLWLFSCQDKSKYVLDEKSEMAQLMLDMHAELDTVQSKIKFGTDIGTYPKAFDGVLDAPMTDESMREEEGYATYAKALIEAEKALYNAPKDKQEAAYKKVVTSCLACHSSVGCSGPIPKIEKLRWSHD